MSVIIKGMEMPKTCTDCPMFRESAYGFGVCKGKGIGFGAEDTEWFDTTRPNWCPLQPLPYKHGRLIDADELEDVFYGFHHSQAAGYVQDAETIVEAEGERDGSKRI